MTTTIYLIRHGEIINPENTIYSRLPGFHLSERGEKQIENTAEFLLNKNIDEIYASPLERAKESAEIIRKKLAISTIRISEEIIESRTSYQGRRFDELDALQSEIFLKPKSPTDETIEQLAQRMLRFIKYIFHTYPEKHIAAVSHGDPIMALKTLIQYNSYNFTLFKTDHYAQQGEVYEIKSDDQNNFSITSIYKPNIS